MAQFIKNSSLNTGFNSLGTSFYPVGMGLSVNLLNQGGYKTWKGDGLNSNPTGIAAGHIRPLTNLDPGNIFPAPFGAARPIKHYRKGRVIPNVAIINLDKTQENKYIVGDKKYIAEAEVGLIQYNLNRSVKSSNGSSLGGGFGGSGLLNEMQDKPGSYLVKQNPVNEINEVLQIQKDCTTCQGVGIVDTYYPNKTYLTENPEPNTQNSILCCNQEKFAKQRVIYASTNLKKNYYTTHTQYLQNRCKTYQQRAFNFEKYNPINIAEINNSQNPERTAALLKASKPGDALSVTNTYFANCQPNAELEIASEINIITLFLDILINRKIITNDYKEAFLNQTTSKISLRNFLDYLKSLPDNIKQSAIPLYLQFIQNPYIGVPLSGPSNPTGCKLVVYKPSNPQFATQGAVESSTRILKLNVTTIEKNAASYYTNSAGKFIGKSTPSDIVLTNVPYLYKNKAPVCNQPPIFPFQNKKACRYIRKPEYYTPVSQGSPYRYLYYSENSTGYGYFNPVKPSNHYRQSPNSNSLL
uniref:Uncharacterized protein n=1 Tax=viral metagenome TaxID=1070528 RepID=A0A6C0DK72_9ZZZZ